MSAPTAASGWRGASPCSPAAPGWRRSRAAEIDDRFRRPRVAGIDTELGVAIALTPGSEVRLGGRYTRYFASFDPEVGDAAVAGGALDQQIQMGVALRYAH